MVDTRMVSAKKTWLARWEEDISLKQKMGYFQISGGSPLAELSMAKIPLYAHPNGIFLADGFSWWMGF